MQPKFTLKNLKGMGVKLAALTLVFFLSLQYSNAQSSAGKKNTKSSETQIKAKNDSKSVTANSSVKAQNKTNLKKEMAANAKRTGKYALVSGKELSANKKTSITAEEKLKLERDKKASQNRKVSDGSKDEDPKASPNGQ